MIAISEADWYTLWNRVPIDHDIFGGSVSWRQATVETFTLTEKDLRTLIAAAFLDVV